MSSVSVTDGTKSSISEDPELIASNKSCVARLQELNINPAPQLYLEPTPGGNTGKPRDIQTNVFGIEVSKERIVYQYVVHMKADLTPSKEVIFTKKGKEDFIVRERHTKCCDIFIQAVKDNEHFFKAEEGNHLIYDGQNVLFSAADLFPGINDLEKKKVIFQVDGSQMSNIDLNALSSIMFEIRAAKHQSFTVSGEKIARRTADTNLKANNRAYSQFLELLLNQTCIKDPKRFGCYEHGKIFCLEPANEHYEPNDYPDVGDGKALLPGLKKSIQFVEGPFGRGNNNPSVVIDALKAAFHKAQPLGEKIFEILHKDPSNGMTEMEKERVLPVIKGLYCNTQYTGRQRHLRIEGISNDNAVKAKFETKEGKSVTVLQYFKEKYNYDIQYPKANLVICKERGNLNFFPLELLNVDNEQRVTIPQLTSAQSQKTTKECAVLPECRQRLIITGKIAADIVESNELFQYFGIKVYDDPMTIAARELESKVIKFSTRTTPAANGKWRSPLDNFNRPAVWPKVWAAYAVGTAGSRFTEKDLHDFIVKLLESCRKRGITITHPVECDLVSANEIEAKLYRAAANQCKFVFIISEDNVTHLHQKFKFIERTHEMIIQDMKMSRAISVLKQNKHLTLENVVNKTNVKLGGLNHQVVDPSKSIATDQLIIGVGVSAPVALAKFAGSKGILNPLVIGYSSNAKSPYDFTGDFILTPSGQDTISSIEEILNRSIQAFETNRKKLPSKIIVYRSGASEGSHAAIISYEIPLARFVLNSFSEEMKLIYIVVTKDHSYRFFNTEIDSKAKTTEQNIQPGIAVDTAVTHPACKQFFLNSHTTLQGTAKTPLFTILADDCNAPMNKLEELTFTLCHFHQIVALTTSLPTPLYVANEYAKRGRNLWTERSTGLPIEINEKGEEEMLKELTMELGYLYSPELSDKRINA